MLLLLIKIYWVKSFKPVLPKGFSFFQLLICFTLFKNHKIPIINSTLAIETKVSMKTFLKNFLVTFSECAIFTFAIVEGAAKIGSSFSDVENFTTDFAF